MKLNKMIMLATLLACSLSFLVVPVFAAYPERPITMVIAYSAGGGTDVGARAFAPYLEKYLGQSIVIINKPGAGGELGFTEIVNSKPDGYTIGFSNTPTFISIPIQRKTRFSVDMAAPIANIVDDPSAISVQSNSDIKSLDDLIAYAKANPGKVTYGSSGVGSDDHLAVLAFMRKAGIEMRHVPFSGEANVRAALLGGHIMVGSMNLSGSLPYQKEGKIQILAHMGRTRWDMAPNVPTMTEQGFPIVFGATRGLSAPAGTPEDILTTLSDAVKKAVADPGFIEQAAKLNLPLAYLNAADYKKSLYDLQAELQTVWDTTPWAEKK